LTEKTCTACVTGTYSATGAKSCTACEDTNCADCTAENTCKTCKDGFGVTVDKKCGACSDNNENCLSCSGYLRGQCTQCAEGYTLSKKGFCKSDSAPEVVKGPAVKSKLRFGMTMDDFTAYGGNNYCANMLADALKVDADQVDCYDVQPGSVIILFRVFTVAGSTVTTDNLASSITDAFNSGSLNIFGDAGILDAPTTSISETDCGLGQYEDSTGTCQNCSEDCPNCTSATECNKKSHRLGAILGGVLGGLAFILIIVVLVAKKDALMNLGSAKSGRSTKYNLANSSPTSPTVPQEHI